MPAQLAGFGLDKTLGSKRHRALIELIIKRREAIGMTQTEFARRLGEYQSFVGRLESGQRRVDVVEFIELAEALGFDPARMISGLKKIS
jgi:transcriptional regulator with XRE-family HTH domain